ncbi:hypothetical protein FSP39_008547 [Pinctada imbricata]|uniref:Uncharacterized protein n=1 Tax=Pinctada imbricata TaxID=66713 RepID=A0AA88XPV1_PINIB|nr:hypothetical protein FSP39_008547 [Pinctada imbricata]
MLEEPPRWATLTQMGHHGLGGFDARMTTMKLKQRALTGKPQNKRGTTPTPIQKRNLDKYPMDRSKDEVLKITSAHGYIRKELEKRVKQARIDSGHLRQYSQRMFDDVVCNTEPINNKEPPSRETSNCRPISAAVSTTSSKKEPPTLDRPLTGTTGPSSTGEMYSKRSKLLNCIRLRPNSEPPMRYNHERSKVIQPEIQKAIHQSNNDFRVVMPASSMSSAGSTVSSVSEYRLVPLNSFSSQYSSVQNLNDDNIAESSANAVDNSVGSKSCRPV